MFPVCMVDCGKYSPVLAPASRPETVIETATAITAITVNLPHHLSKKEGFKILNYEKNGDRAMSALAASRDKDDGIKLADRAINDYKNAIAIDAGNYVLVHKYCRVVEIKYNFLIPDDERENERLKVYADTLSMLEKIYPGDDNPVYADYDKALFLVLNGQQFNIFQVIGVVNRVYELCEKIYKTNPGFEDYSAEAALGRLNYLAPNIPFFITWPDKRKSLDYLVESLKNNPGSFEIKYFLADSLYALGEKDKAAVYYREVMEDAPRRDINYFEDNKVKRNCAVRMKELGVQ